MKCLNCKDKEISSKHHDKAVIDRSVCELHRDCGECGEVFIIFINSNNLLDIRRK